MSYPRFQRSRDFKFLRHTASTLTLNSTSWANMPTIATLSVTAEAGDVIEAVFYAYHGGETPSAQIDAVTEVSSSPVTAFSSGDAAPTSTTVVGAGVWLCAASQDGAIGGSVFHTLLAGDVSSGAVTVRMRYRTSSASNKTLNVTGGNIGFAVRNLGPVDPH